MNPADYTGLDLDQVIARAPLDTAINVAVGRASVCWVNPATGQYDPTGVFDDATATRIASALVARISAELAGPTPHGSWM